MEIFILENESFESASTWSCDAKEGIMFAIEHLRSDHKYQLTFGKGNPTAEAYLKKLVSMSDGSKSDIIVRLRTDAAASADSNKISLQVEGFCTDESNKFLWTLGRIPTKLRVSVGMTKFIPMACKTRILERGLINKVEMTLSNPQVSGLPFPTSLLETCYSDKSPLEHRHLRLVGTVSIALVCDFHLPCHAWSISKRVLLNRILTDVDIVCKGRTFKCHKIFLAAQSTCFAKMFQNDSEMKRVIIEDFHDGVVAALVAYFYDGIIAARIQLDPKLEVELLRASHKYGVAELVEKLKTAILAKDINLLDLESALQLFLFARGLDESFSELKTKAVKFMKLKFEKIVMTGRLFSLFNGDHTAAVMELSALGISFSNSIVRIGGKRVAFKCK